MVANVGETSAQLGEVTNIKQKSTADSHIPSSTQADTLFNFTKQLAWLHSALEKRSLFPRYNIEDIEYLKIQNIPNVAFPMKCFCDINLHKLKDHLAWYGYYGIAFKKEWGMSKNIQPVHYMNPNSPLAKEFSMVFNEALIKPPSDEVGKHLLDHLLHELMYYKPYQGLMFRSGNKRKQRKCFSDESEWRYIPKIIHPNLEQLYFQANVLNDNLIGYLNEQIQTFSDLAITFNYDDVKYIIVRNSSDFEATIAFFEDLPIEPQSKYVLSSKIIVWDESTGDF
ncbi:MAG TPA: abortive infection system antitoxin AbiGi family protein [Clostridia bacterium]|nr:abortive infection system antitoxin AbiGi family protein [Clostridia bacterium]